MVVSLKNLCEIHKLGVRTREWMLTPRQVPAFRRSHIHVAGHTEAKAGYRFVRHAPPFGQILACTGGEGEVFVDGGWQRCGPGVAYITPPRTPCAYHIVPGKEWKVAWVLYEESAEFPTLKRGDPVRVRSVDAQGLSLAVEGLCHAVSVDSEPGLLEHWTALVHRVALRVLDEKTDAETYAFRRLWTEVRHDLARSWDLEKMARLAGMSEETLRRRCLAQFAQPPMAYLIRLRMQFAADLLASTREKVSAIAGRAGYTDAFAFSNAFRREFGFSPKHYRLETAMGAQKRSGLAG